MASRALRLAPALALALAACGGPSHYVHPNADLGGVKTVAVLPFENMTQERVTADKVQNIFLTELLALNAFDVVEPGLVQRALRAERIEATGAMTPAEMKKVAEALRAQALFVGAVLDFSDGRSAGAAAPQVTIQVRLVEGASGITMWSTSQTRSGTSVTSRLFGIGGETTTEVARSLVHDQLKTLVR